MRLIEFECKIFELSVLTIDTQVPLDRAVHTVTKPTPWSITPTVYP